MTSNVDAHSDNAATPNGASETSTIGQSMWAWIEETGWARVRYGTLGTGTHWAWTSGSGWTRYTTPTEDAEASAMHAESTSTTERRHGATSRRVITKGKKIRSSNTRLSFLALSVVPWDIGTRTRSVPSTRRALLGKCHLRRDIDHT